MIKRPRAETKIRSRRGAELYVSKLRPLLFWLNPLLPFCSAELLVDVFVVVVIIVVVVVVS